MKRKSGCVRNQGFRDNNVEFKTKMTYLEDHAMGTVFCQCFCNIVC